MSSSALIDYAIEVWGLDPALASHLKEDGISSFFPVQSAVLPILLKSINFPFVTPRDICVSAPTGSGKTLSYAIPVIQALKERCEPQLRALILLPSRELAAQVYNVFCRLARGSDLRIALATGQNNLEDERSMLCEVSSSTSPPGFISNSKLYENFGGVSNTGKIKVDILICTPGRLLEHLQTTPGFTLFHLRYLILDEADRLLGNAFDHWVRLLIQSADPLIEKSMFGDEARDSAHKGYHLQRMLFSATLTDNPRKLHLLGIKYPLIINTMTAPRTSAENTAVSYSLPTLLTECVCMTNTADRPLALLGIVHDAIYGGSAPHGGLCSTPDSMILIFTSSVDACHKLCRLLQVVNNQIEIHESSGEPIFKQHVREMTRNIRAADRESTMVECRNNNVKILVSSDQLARGIDLSNIKLVINYDPPKFAKTYVHRAGRTARANRSGLVVTMLKTGQMGEFKKMRNQIDTSGDKISKLKIVCSDSVKDRYNVALGSLSTVMKLEDEGELGYGVVSYRASTN